jgi:hypothetical protein
VAKRKKKRGKAKKPKMKIGQTKTINTPAGKRKIKKFKGGRVRIVGKA